MKNFLRLELMTCLFSWTWISCFSICRLSTWGNSSSAKRFLPSFQRLSLCSLILYCSSLYLLFFFLLFFYFRFFGCLFLKFSPESFENTNKHHTTVYCWGKILTFCTCNYLKKKKSRQCQSIHIAVSRLDVFNLKYRFLPNGASIW